MKKVLALLLAVVTIAVLSFLCAAPALADDGTGGNSFGFFSWEMLATYAGALAATIAVTQLLKASHIFEKIPTRMFSWFVAVVVLLASNYFLGVLTVETASICILNAVVVSLAANGGYDAVTSSIMKKT